MQAPGDTVLVAGATGGVGQILTAKLLEVAIIKCLMLPFIGFLSSNQQSKFCK